MLACGGNTPMREKICGQWDDGGGLRCRNGQYVVNSQLAAKSRRVDVTQLGTRA
jgi:hypothetical protein